MNKNIIYFMAMLVLLAAGTAHAEIGATPVATSNAAPAVSSVKGTIAAVDLQAALPSIKVQNASGQTSAFYLDKGTSVWKAGKQTKLDDLKVGSKVSIRHSSTGGKEFAKSIDIQQ